MPNEFLQSLAKPDLALLWPYLHQVVLRHGDQLAATGKPIEKVYFPITGLISIVVELSAGERIEAAVAGRNGMVGAGVALGVPLSLNTALVQMPGSFHTLKAAELIDAAGKSASLRAALFREEQYLLAQAQHTAACNARHQISSRLSTWLLRVGDAVQTEELALTQEFLAQMLGVQRASVSMVASSFQDAGTISYRRGRIRITDRPQLEDLACECYALLRKQHQRLFPERHQDMAANKGEPAARARETGTS